MAALNGLVLFATAAATIAVVTAPFLNLDTSVVFLTPVLVYATRSRGQGEVPLLVGCLLLSNAGSLLLPGSNLTNLIVLGHLHLSGGEFSSRMVLPVDGGGSHHRGGHRRGPPALTRERHSGGGERTGGSAGE